MATPEQALSYLMGMYTRETRKLTQYATIQEADIDAFLLGTHLTMILSQFDRAPDYQPIKELEMVLTVCDKLKESGQPTEMQDFWLHLYKQSQAILERLKINNPKGAVDYEKCLEIFESFGLHLESLSGRKREAESASLELEIAKMWDKDSEAKVQKLLEAAKQGNLGEFEEYDLQSLNKRKKDYEKYRAVLEEVKAGSHSDEDLLSIMNLALSNYVRGNKISLKGLSECLKTIEDKRKVSHMLLNAYQDRYEGYSRYDFYSRNHLLLGFSDLIECLKSILPKADLMMLIKETGFTLSDPHKMENDAEYRRFITERNAYVGRVDLSKLQEEDYYSADLMGSIASGLLSSLSLVEDDAQLRACLASPIPFLIQAELAKDLVLQREFMKFHETFIKVNSRADKQHARDPDLFFMTHQAAIAQHLMLFGVAGVKLLRAQLAETVVSLERFCENIPVLDKDFITPLKVYFDHHKALIAKDPLEYDACHKLILTMSTLTDMQSQISYGDLEKKAFKEKLIADMTGKKPSEYASLIFRQLLTTMLGELEVDLDAIDIDAIFKRMPPDKFTQLVAASLRMQDSEYKEVFSRLLYLDLTGGDIDEFLHNVEQDNDLGKSLAEHNEGIQKKLKALGIDPKIALKYPKSRDIVIYPGDGDGAKVDNALSVLWTYCESFKAPLYEKIEALQALGHNISEPNKKILQQCLSIDKQLTEITKKIERAGGQKALLSVFNKADTRAQLEKIDRNLKALASTYDKYQQATKGEAAAPLFSASFMEFLGHVREQHAHVKTFDGMAKKKTSKSAPRKAQSFSIVQWDKRDPMTSFLGDEVGCCLGSTSSQFPALVQRRMDDGMLFHVAVDKSTGKPAALLWLYLAEKPDGTIAVVANFTEVNTKYAVDESTRKALLNELVTFTHEYCQDNKIDDFYMNVLTYGWNIKDLEGYPIVDFDIKDKLGGPFLPGYGGGAFTEEEAQQVREMTGHHYYLASLQKVDKQFHQVTPAILKLKQEAIPNSMIIRSIVEGAIRQCSSETEGEILSLESIKAHVMKHHGLELQPFFDDALRDDPDFHALVEKVMGEVLATLQSEPKKGASPGVQDDDDAKKAMGATLPAEHGFFGADKGAGNTESLTANDPKCSEGDPRLQKNRKNR